MPPMIAPTSGDHADASCSGGHSGASRGHRPDRAASRPATNSAAALAASHGGQRVASTERGALRAYQAPIPAVKPNSNAPNNAPTTALIASMSTCDSTGSAVANCIDCCGQELASASNARTNVIAATAL